MNILKQPLILALFALPLIVLNQASAGVIIGADSVTMSGGTTYSAYSPTNTIDQSGLSAAYLHGVTDYDTFISSTTIANGGDIAAEWMNGSPVDYFYNFDKAYDITSFALWNRNCCSSQGIKNFNLWGTSDGFGSEQLLLSNEVGYGTIALAQIYDFSEFTANGVRLEVLSTYQSGGLTTHDEVAFEANLASLNIPEPSIIALMGLGVAGIAFTTRRKKVVIV